MMSVLRPVFCADLDQDEQGSLTVVFSDGARAVLSDTQTSQSAFLKECLECSGECDLSILLGSNVWMQHVVVDSLQHVAAAVAGGQLYLSDALTQFVGQKALPARAEKGSYKHFKLLLHLGLAADKIIFPLLETACMNLLIDQFSDDDFAFFIRGSKLPQNFALKLERVYCRKKGAPMPLVFCNNAPHFQARLDQLVDEGYIAAPEGYGDGEYDDAEKYADMMQSLLRVTPTRFTDLPRGQFTNDILGQCYKVVVSKVDDNSFNQWYLQINDLCLLREASRCLAVYAVKFVNNNYTWVVEQKLTNLSEGIVHTAFSIAYFQKYNTLPDAQLEKFSWGDNQKKLEALALLKIQFARARKSAKLTLGGVFAMLNSKSQVFIESIIALSEGFCGRAITYMSLVRCRLRKIPTTIFLLADLEELMLSGNYIKTLPRNIEVLSGLKKLILNSCRIEDFATFILPGLEELQVSGNYKLDSFVGGKMPNLRKIVFNRNDISFTGIARFTKLQELSIKGSRQVAGCNSAVLERCRALKVIISKEDDYLAGIIAANNCLKDKLTVVS